VAFLRLTSGVHSISFGNCKFMRNECIGFRLGQENHDI
jgi:hypothetical protein